MNAPSKMVLLGAGASVEAGIPAAVPLTETILNNFRVHSRTGQVLRYVYGGLMLGKGARGEDPLAGINIEDLVEATKQLANRKNLQIAPFISLWNEGVTAFQERDTRELMITAMQEIIDITETRDSERALRNLTLDTALQDLADQQTRDFGFAAQGIIRALLELLWLEDASRVAYFAPLVRLGETASFTVASLNYDNTIELACRTHGIPCTTGLDSWNAFKGFVPPEKGIELIKLHGSVTWEERTNAFNPTPEQPMPGLQVLEREREQVHRSYKPALIFGSGNKLTAEGPFLELLMTFRKRLQRCEELVVVGYSFADPHINDAIWRWLNRDTARTLQVIDYAADGAPPAFMRRFRYLEGRLTLHLEGAGAGLARVFG